MNRNTCVALILLLAASACVLAWGLQSDIAPLADLTKSTSFVPTWEGKVLGTEGPLGGAQVRIQATDVCTRTNAAGRFRLPRERESVRITAWQPGYFIGGVDSQRGTLAIRLQPLPQKDNDNYEWVDPRPDPTQAGNCANCHAAIYDEWSHSPHARSVEGKNLRKLYEQLLSEKPLGSAVCAACHAPSLTDESTRLDMRAVTGVAAQGVHCDYCHKVAAVRSESPSGAHGSFDQDLLRPADPDQQIFFGALDDVDRGEDVYSPLYRDSRYCAGCHEGVVLGVHVYSTWSEWKASAAAAAGIQCQDCHMKPTGRMTNMASGHGGKQRPAGTLANHRFFDGSHEEMLRRCVQLDTTVVRQQGGLRATVRLTAEGAGHRVPTGFIDRHLILVVEGLGASGAQLPVNAGPRLPAAAGDLAGGAGKVYGRRLTDDAGRTPSPFWRPVREIDDTRLTVGKPDDTVVEFPPDVTKVRIRLLYRRFWQDSVRSRGLNSEDSVVLDRVYEPDYRR